VGFNLIGEQRMVSQDIREMLDGLIADAGLTVKPAYSVGEVARILNISQNTVRKICDAWEENGENAGALRCYRFGAKRERRVPRSNLEAWLARNDGYETTCR
jgi:transposase